MNTEVTVEHLDVKTSNSEIAYQLLSENLADNNFDRLTQLKVEEIICTTALTAHA